MFTSVYNLLCRRLFPGVFPPAAKAWPREMPSTRTDAKIL
jgi:hypothetical protein